jgi:phage/plasmid-like protein (TIGR03299 family)
MSHELERFTDGSAAFVSARQHAWHRLGTVLPDAFTASQAMEYARLGWWNVRKEHLQAVVVTDEGVSKIDVADHYASVRTNPVTGQPEVLGVVGEQYVPVQNEELCELLDAVVDEGGAHFETAGSLRGGRQVFVSMKFPAGIKIGGVDAMNLYLCALSSHDGSRALTGLATPVRVLCANTQAAALRNHRASFTIRHTRGAKFALAEARRALQLTFDHFDAFGIEAEKMINETLTDDAFAKITAELWPLNSETESVRSRNNSLRRDHELAYLWHDADTNAAIRGTRWAGYQAITEYLDPHTPVGPKRDAAKVRAERAISPATTALKARAFDLLSLSGGNGTGRTETLLAA